VILRARGHARSRVTGRGDVQVNAGMSRRWGKANPCEMAQAASGAVAHEAVDVSVAGRGTARSVSPALCPARTARASPMRPSADECVKNAARRATPDRPSPAGSGSLRRELRACRTSGPSWRRWWCTYLTRTDGRRHSTPGSSTCTAKSRAATRNRSLPGTHFQGLRPIGTRGDKMHSPKRRAKLARDLPDLEAMDEPGASPQRNA